jgi:4-oxalocrotonate tautomerase family enzyme
MPTYTVSSLKNRLTDPQKASLAAALTDIHCQVMGAPRYFVQVIFVDVPTNNYFIAGKRPNATSRWHIANLSILDPRVDAFLSQRASVCFIWLLS